MEIKNLNGDVIYKDDSASVGIYRRAQERP